MNIIMIGFCLVWRFDEKYWSGLFGLLFLLGGLSVEKSAHGAVNGTHTKEFPNDFDRLKTVLQQPNTFSALTPEWLDWGVEHRIRYETFNQSFTKGTAGSDQMLRSGRGFCWELKDI